MQDITINVYALLGFCPSTTWWLKIHYVLLYTVNSKFRHPLRQTQKCNMEEHGPWPLKLILKTVFPLQKPGAAFNFLCWRKCNLDHLYIYIIYGIAKTMYFKVQVTVCVLLHPERRKDMETPPSLPGVPCFLYKWAVHMAAIPWDS